MVDKTRRSLIMGLPLLIGACALTKDKLSTNTLNNFKKGEVSVSEDIIRMQKIGILDEYYFAIPMNNETRVLNNGEPSFYLIPEKESRITITDVGERGGEVQVDAPQKGIYFPYPVKPKFSVEVDEEFSEIKPMRLITGYKIEDIKKPNAKNSKINLEKITEKDFPFSDELLKTIGNTNYLVSGMNDHATIKNKENVLPIYFTKTPFDVEYNRTEKDKYIRIKGKTFVFIKGKTMDEYLDKRGYANPIKVNAEKTKEKQGLKASDAQE